MPIPVHDLKILDDFGGSQAEEEGLGTSASALAKGRRTSR